MKVRIDSARRDLANNFVVDFTVIMDNETFSAYKGKKCMVFPNRAAIAAFMDAAQERSFEDALRTALRKWRQADSNLASLAGAAGYTSE